jgi:molybdate transport system regulatory protein
VRNQLFGCITEIRAGKVNAEVMVQLKGSEIIATTTDLSLLSELALTVGVDAVLLINSTDITLVVNGGEQPFSARNRLAAQVLSIQENAMGVEVVVLLPSGETLIVGITAQGLQNLELSVGMPVWAIFKSNVPHLGVKA